MVQSKTSSALTTRQKKTADEIADICISNWDTYGRLPSIAVGQAFVESGLGSGPNLFGVMGQSGRSVYGSTIGYLECLRNEYFRGEGAFVLDREEHLSIVMKGGRYCEGEHPGGNYWNNVISSIYRYGWNQFDEVLEKKLANKERKRLRKKRQQGSFRIIFSDELTEGTCIVDPGWIKKGSTIIYPGGIVEATSTKSGLGNTIIAGCEKSIFPQTVGGFDFFDLEKLRINIDVFEDSKG